MRTGIFILLQIIAGLGCLTETALAQEVFIRSAAYTPFFRDKNEDKQIIAALLVDKYPVTNRDFLKFVKAQPEWSRGNVKRIFADAHYLEHWPADLELSPGIESQPVTNVSWFVARRYCASKGKRLLSMAEWEYVSRAQDPENLELVLKWYGQTNDPMKSVRAAKANAFGVVGMHGLIWEWVDDFSSAIVAGDSRSSNETSRSMFCGSGSLNAKDPTKYATFMRFAHRSSLKADSTGRNLGFRCAQNAR